MDRPDPVDRLLSRGALSAPERERIFANVYRVSTRRPVRLYAVLFCPLLVAAAAILFLRPGSGDNSGFSAKGSGSLPAVEMDCFPGSASACPLGSTLILRAKVQESNGLFLHAYADPLNGTNQRIWYLPTQDTSPFLVTPGMTGTLQPAIRVGNEHRPGRYRIHLIWAKAPMTHEQLLRGDDRVVSSEIVEITVVEP
jgi:hypothetical protein